MTPRTYLAVQALGDGDLELTRLPLVRPGTGQVQLRVEACGICPMDAATIDGGFPGLTYPRVPGHQVIGTIEALGDPDSEWTIGQRVGVGFMNGPGQIICGISVDGGYAEAMIAEQDVLVAIPEKLGTLEAAPLLCGGATIFNALKATRGDEVVAIHGLAGPGHLAIQFASRMGFHTVAIDRGGQAEEIARALGARDFVDSDAEDPAAVLREFGGAATIIATTPSLGTISATRDGLRRNGRLIVFGPGSEDVHVDARAAISETLDFSVRNGIRAIVETVSLDNVRDAYLRGMRNEARYFMVLTSLR
jgi:propanol-preferring alcohol dehydrogenase